MIQHHHRDWIICQAGPLTVDTKRIGQWFYEHDEYVGEDWWDKPDPRCGWAPTLDEAKKKIDALEGSGIQERVRKTATMNGKPVFP